MNPRIYLSSPHLAGNERKYVNEAFDANWVAPLGPNVDQFEKDIQKYANIDHCAVLSSGTAAIHLALIMLGVGPGDIVICQSFTFSASANPIVYQGATPVFIDSEKDTWNMDPELLEEAVLKLMSENRRPKAIIPVHLYGMPAKMNEINAIAAEHGIPVIEDAAEALGSSYHGQKCGTFGKLGVFSFNGNKIITTSGGGALVSNDEALIQKARFLATQARDPAPHYQHSEIGYNYRMSNVCAGIGRGQLEILDSHVAKRRANFDWYKQIFQNIEGVSFLEEPEGSFSNRWLTTMLIDPEKTNGITRETLRKAFLEDNIESRPLWKPMHLQPVFSDAAVTASRDAMVTTSRDAMVFASGVSEELFEKGLCLPSGSNLSEEERERIERVVRGVFEN